MKTLTIKRPSAAFVIGMIALFVALGGTAGAVATATVPLAKRALMADNAKKLNGVTAAQLGSAAAQAGAQLSAKVAGPASTAGGLVAIKTQGGSVPAGLDLSTFAVSCDAGTKVIGGGMSSDGAIGLFDSYPKGDAAWEIVVANFGDGGASVTAYAICLK